MQSAIPLVGKGDEEDGDDASSGFVATPRPRLLGLPCWRQGEQAPGRATRAAAVLVVLLLLYALLGGGEDEGDAPPDPPTSPAAPTAPPPATPAAQRTETVYYFGDPQIGMGKSGWEMDRDRFAAAARASDGATAVVVAGDVVNVWDNQQYIDAASEVLAMFEAPQGVHLSRGIHVVPGNHGACRSLALLLRGCWLFT